MRMNLFISSYKDSVLKQDMEGSLSYNKTKLKTEFVVTQSNNNNNSKNVIITILCALNMLSFHHSLTLGT